MMNRHNVLLFVGVVLFFLIVGCVSTPFNTQLPAQDVPKKFQEKKDANNEQNEQVVDFSEYNPVFRFSATLPHGTGVEYVQEIEAINIYGPIMSATSPRLLSQIFIRHFNAHNFLTLSTVTIIKQELTTVGTHDAMRYEIQKNKDVAPFPHQPLWRNDTHQLIDIRFEKNDPSEFYVFAHNPQFSNDEFDQFIQSISFHNDRESFVEPLFNASQRITKKPFGIHIFPDDSPISSDRFVGYHTGVDYEIFDDEKEKDVEIFSVCGGHIVQKKRANGYGGVIVQECLLNDEPITVIYGHIALASVIQNVGDYVVPDEQIGFLGAGFSFDTDKERKHLHLGVHKGASVDLRGYVDNLADLEQWVDSALLF